MCVFEMSDIDESGEQTASRGKSPGELNNSEAFEAFGLFREYLDSKLSDLRKDISDQTVKLKRKTPTFRLESHRHQFEFNSEIQEGLESISSGIRQQDARLCNDLILKLKRRNKLIKVADRSPGGWTTVREYEGPSLCGSDSEDDRKLKQAEARAVKKIKFSYTKSSTVQASSVNNGSDKGSTTFMPSDVPRSGANYQFPGGPAWGRNRGTFPFRGERQATASDICFGCGLTGHFRRSCPNKINPQGQYKFGWDVSQRQQPERDNTESKPAVTDNK